MKWILRNDKIPRGDKSLFGTINLKHKNGDPGLPEELYKLGFVEWVTYPGPENRFKPLPPLKLPASKRKYEIFCGGFLYYHDIEVKLKKEGKNFEHKLFFEWFLGGKANRVNMVRIYINETPPQFNPNPPRPPAPPPPESNP